MAIITIMSEYLNYKFVVDSESESRHYGVTC